MTPFTVLQALAVPLDRANVDTDAIIPKQFLKSIYRSGYGPNLFHDWRYLEGDVQRPNPDFVLNHPRYQGAHILVALENFGCGSSREHAAWALDNYGIRCVVAPSFSDIFFNNALKNGLLPARVSAEAARAFLSEIQATPGCQLTVDLPNQTVSSPGGLRAEFPLDAESKRRLLAGLDDIGITLQHTDEIDMFEARRARYLPWM